MNTYKYSYYIFGSLHSGLVGAENEAEGIAKLIKQMRNPENMHGLTIELFRDKTEPKVVDTHVKDLIKNLKAQLEEYEECIDYYETRNLELVAKNDELETQLLQYKIYVSDITTAIQKNICKDFCPNIVQPT